MLAVDISGSMATEDMEIDGDYVERLAVVKAVIANFAKARVGDRIGLVLFGTNAYLQAPLTFDVKSVNRLLIEAPVGIAGGKTAIGDAIGLAVKRLRLRPQDEKVLILSLMGPRTLARSNQGSPQSWLPEQHRTTPSVGCWTKCAAGSGPDQRAHPILLQTSTRRLCRALPIPPGAVIFVKDPRALIEIYAPIDQLEPVEQEAEIFRPVQSLYFWPLGGSLLVWVLVLWDFRRRLQITGASHA